MRRLIYLLPLVLFAALALFLWHGLHDDPSFVPSALINKPAPAFELAGLPATGKPGFNSEALKGRVTLVSVFASWCVPCLQEHPLLMSLSDDKRLRLVGIAYKDKPGDSTAWLARQGDPYQAIGSDIDGRVGIDFGVYGVPESYLVDKTGVIRFKQVGPLTQAALEKQILPLAEQLAR